MKKNCIITGASSGLGADLVERLVTEGYNILTMQRHPPSRHAGLHWIEADFSDITFGWEKTLDLWIKEHGDIDLLVNNAAQYVRGSFNNSQINKIISINLISPIALTNKVVNSMGSNSLIININSVAGIYGMEFEPVYSASKHGLKGFSKSLRLLLSSKKVNVCDIYPGGMNTELWNSSNPYPGKDVKDTMNTKDISDFLMYVINSPCRETLKELVIHPFQEKFV